MCGNAWVIYTPNEVCSGFTIFVYPRVPSIHSAFHQGSMFFPGSYTNLLHQKGWHCRANEPSMSSMSSWDELRYLHKLETLASFYPKSPSVVATWLRLATYTLGMGVRNVANMGTSKFRMGPWIRKSYRSHSALTGYELCGWLSQLRICAFTIRLVLHQRMYQILGCVFAQPIPCAEISLCYELGVSENSVPLNPMVNDHYPY